MAVSGLRAPPVSTPGAVGSLPKGASQEEKLIGVNSCDRPLEPVDGAAYSGHGGYDGPKLIS